MTILKQVITLTLIIEWYRLQIVDALETWRACYDVAVTILIFVQGHICQNHFDNNRPGNF